MSLGESVTDVLTTNRCAGIPGGMQIIFWRLSVGQATRSPDPRLLAANPAGSFGQGQLSGFRTIRAFAASNLERMNEVEPAPDAAAEKPAWRRYAGALVCILVAFGVRYWISPLVGDELPFMLFIAASLVAAWYGGAVAGIVALLLGLLLADHFFLVHGRSGVTHPTQALYFVRYLFTASLGVALIETLHRTRRKLEAEVARRRRSESALLEAQERLRTHAQDLEHCVARRTSELAATVKYLESLLYHIGHNLRAPLRAMEGYATVLVDEYGSRLDATAREYSAHISDDAKRMDQLIHDLLEYGRLGYVQLELGPVNLEKVLEQVLFRLGFEIRSTGADVQFDRPLPTVRANPEMLEQVLTNLVENAARFVPAGVRPEIRVSAETRGNRVLVWVHDNGVGIPTQFRQRIFGVFETLGPPGRHGGTGIGLAIVQQAMQRMGGSVGVESNPGQGSSFWIELSEAEGRGALLSTPPSLQSAA